VVTVRPSNTEKTCESHISLSICSYVFSGSKRRTKPFTLLQLGTLTMTLHSVLVEELSGAEARKETIVRLQLSREVISFIQNARQQQKKSLKQHPETVLYNESKPLGKNFLLLLWGFFICLKKKHQGF